MTFRLRSIPTLLILLSSVALPMAAAQAQSLSTKELNARAQAQASTATANLPPPPADRNTPFAVSTDPVEALSRYLRILATSPRDLNALTGAGNAALAIGDANAAISLFARAEEVSPRNGRIKAGLASGLVQLDQPLTAIKLFDEAVSLGVPEAEIAGDRGLAYDLRGETRRAQADYAQALRWRSDDEVTRRLAVSQAIAGDKSAALSTLDGLLRRQDRAAWRVRAFVLALTGDRSGAEAAAIAVMPRGQAQALIPFFGRLAVLRPAQKAAAVHLGQFPADGGSSTASQPMFADATPPPLPARAASGQVAATPLVSASTAPGSRSNGSTTPERFGGQDGVSSSPKPTTPASLPAASLRTAPVASAGQLAPRSGSSAAASAPPTPSAAIPPIAAPTPAPGPAGQNQVVPTNQSPQPSAVPTARDVNAATRPTAAPFYTAPARSSAASRPLSMPGTAAENTTAEGDRREPLAPDAVVKLPGAAPSTHPSVSPGAQNAVAAAGVGPAAGFVSEPLAPPSGGGATRLALSATPSPGPAGAAVRSFDLPESTISSAAAATASIDRAAVAEPARPSRRTAARVPEAASDAASPATRRTTHGKAEAMAAQTKANKARTKADAAEQAENSGITADRKFAATGKDGQGRKSKKDTTDIKAALDAKDNNAKDGKAALDAKNGKASKRDAKADRKSEDEAGDKPNGSSGGEKYWVQVASGTNRDDLGKAWGKTKAKAPKLLGSRTTWTTPWKQSNRLLVGPFKSEEEAQGLVNSLGRAGLGGIPYTTRGKAKVEKLGE